MIKVLMTIVAVLAIAFIATGCDGGNSSTGSQQTCVGDYVQCALTDRGATTVQGLPFAEIEGDELTAGGTSTDSSDNPFNCPVGTLIRSDCSVESQRLCRCMLPAVTPSQ